MKVSSYMCAKVQSVALGTPVGTAFEMMQAGGFRHLPVLDEQRRVVGIVSDRDLRNVLVIYPNGGRDEYLSTDDTTVDQVMAPDPISVTPDSDIVEAARLIRAGYLSCLVVCDGDRLVGMLSYLDLLDALLALLNAQGKDTAA